MDHLLNNSKANSSPPPLKRRCRLLPRTSNSIIDHVVRAFNGGLGHRFKILAHDKMTRGDFEVDWLRLKRKTLQAVLDQCQRALESLGTTADGGNDDDEEEEEDRDSGSSGEAVDEARARRRLCLLIAKLTRQIRA